MRSERFRRTFALSGLAPLLALQRGAEARAGKPVQLRAALVDLGLVK